MRPLLSGANVHTCAPYFDQPLAFLAAASGVVATIVRTAASSVYTCALAGVRPVAESAASDGGRVADEENISRKDAKNAKLKSS